eukprot:811881_1
MAFLASLAKRKKKKPVEEKKIDPAKLEKQKKNKAIIDSLTKEDIEKLKEAFALFDKDGSGSIEKEELLDILINLDPRMTREEFEKLVEEYDQDGDGQINWEEFIILMKPAIVDLNFDDHDFKMTEDDMKSAFNIADADGSGLIEKEELGALLASLGEALDMDDLDALFMELDSDKSGGIDFDEFKKLMEVLNTVDVDDESSTSWEYEELSHSSYTYITDSQVDHVYEDVFADEHGNLQ